MAKSVSVAVGESETMRAGRLETVTLPFEPVTVTGNEAEAAAPPDAPATETASAATAVPVNRTRERST